MPREPQEARSSSMQLTRGADYAPLTGTQAGRGESVIVVGPVDVEPLCPPQPARLSAIASAARGFNTTPMFNSIAFIFIFNIPDRRISMNRWPVPFAQKSLVLARFQSLHRSVIRS